MRMVKSRPAQAVLHNYLLMTLVLYCEHAPSYMLSLITKAQLEVKGEALSRSMSRMLSLSVPAERPGCLP